MKVENIEFTHSIYSNKKIKDIILRYIDEEIEVYQGIVRSPNNAHILITISNIDFNYKSDKPYCLEDNNEIIENIDVYLKMVKRNYIINKLLEI